LSEKIYQGLGVSPGVAIGAVYVHESKIEKELVVYDIADEDISAEIERFSAALDQTRDQIKEIRKRVSVERGVEYASIFDVQLHLIEDQITIDEVIEGIRFRKKNAEYVFYQVVSRPLRIIAGSEDEFFSERHTDIGDIMRRMLRNLMQRKEVDFSDMPFATVVVAHDISPSDTAAMEKSKIFGFATDVGGPTSHTAIMARSLGIPAVVGLHKISEMVEKVDQVIIDGNRGLVIVGPEEETLDRYHNEIFRIRAYEDKLQEIRALPAETGDGHKITLAANIEFPEEIETVLSHGAEGIGLFRTEFLYMNRADLPDEDEQFEAYKRVLEGVHPHAVIIRTFDLGGDKFISHLDIPFEMNPFMGWRAIRLSLERSDLFKIQLRAILRAGVYGNMKLMFPMVTSIDEVKSALEIVEEAKQELEQEGVEYSDDFEVGAMIETPSAAMTADILADKVDFFSIGTNDLIQYTLAVERGNDKIAHLYQPCHPAVLRLINQVIEEAHKKNIWVGMCGEMASESPMLLILLGMGLDELSVSPTMVPKIKKVIRSVSYKKAIEFTNEILQLTEYNEIRRRATEVLAKIVPTEK
jgi:phosphoenolpyruvate-protein phosphotransferase (PTS system enzyme I)